jgi:hypothetical protein
MQHAIRLISGDSKTIQIFFLRNANYTEFIEKIEIRK